MIELEALQFAGTKRAPYALEVEQLLAVGKVEGAVEQGEVACREILCVRPDVARTLVVGNRRHCLGQSLSGGENADGQCRAQAPPVDERSGFGRCFHSCGS